jgi:hypothetical protein
MFRLLGLRKFAAANVPPRRLLPITVARKPAPKTKPAARPFGLRPVSVNSILRLLLDLVASRAQALHLGRYPIRVAVGKGEIIKSARVHGLQGTDCTVRPPQSQFIFCASASAFFECGPANEGEEPHGQPVHKRDEKEQGPPAPVASAMEDLLDGNDQSQEYENRDQNVGSGHGEHKLLASA